MNRGQMKLSDIVSETVSTQSILMHEYYVHPDTDKTGIPVPDFGFYLYNYFSRYMAKQIMIPKSVEDVRKLAKDFVQIVAEESVKAREELAKQQENKDDQAHNSVG